jgi:polyisoprenoid-binding protein YceI
MTLTANTGGGTTTETLTGDYTIDRSHSRIGFGARHAMVATVRGQFQDYEATVHLDEADPAKSHAEITIQTASIDTRNADRDAHLSSPDFFDVEKYPTITFRSTSAERKDEDTYVLSGDLTIRDVTRPVSVEFEKTDGVIDPWGNFRVGFEGKATVSRKEWGLTWNMALEAGGVVVGDKVKLEFDIAAVRTEG